MTDEFPIVMIRHTGEQKMIPEDNSAIKGLNQLAQYRCSTFLIGFYKHDQMIYPLALHLITKPHHYQAGEVPITKSPFQFTKEKNLLIT